MCVRGGGWKSVARHSPYTLICEHLYMYLYTYIWIYMYTCVCVGVRGSTLAAHPDIHIYYTCIHKHKLIYIFIYMCGWESMAHRSPYTRIQGGEDS